MISNVLEYPRYFYKCNVCDSNDHGSTFMDYEIVECPSCGTTNMTRWQAPPNLTREWSYCQEFGHQWTNKRGLPDFVEVCSHCDFQRDLSTKKK